MKAKLSIEVNFLPEDPEKARQAIEQAADNLFHYLRWLNGARLDKPVFKELRRNENFSSFGEYTYEERVQDE